MRDHPGTTRDPSGIRSFLMMGPIGVIGTMLGDFLFASSAIPFAGSATGVLVLAGLSACDTQRVKTKCWQGHDTAVAAGKSVMGPRSLRFSPINMFVPLLIRSGNRH